MAEDIGSTYRPDSGGMGGLARRLGHVCLRLALLKGPCWHRVYLAIFYAILVDCAIAWVAFFAPPPGPASAMSGPTVSALVFIAPSMVAGGLLLLAAWCCTHVVVLEAAYRRTLAEPWGLIYAVLPVAALLVLVTAYDAFLSGHGTAIHAWLHGLRFPDVPSWAVLAAPLAMPVSIVCFVVAWLLHDAPEPQ